MKSCAGCINLMLHLGLRDVCSLAVTDAPHGHLVDGFAAHPGLRLLKDGVELVAQVARGSGASGARATRPFRADRRGVRGAKGRGKELVLVAAGAGGRLRLAQTENNDENTLKCFADGQVATDAHVITDGR